jgi:hypothetical protein
LISVENEKYEAYSLNVSFSKNEINLSDLLIVEVVITHPQNVKVDTIKLTRELLQNNSKMAAPFLLVSKDVKLDSEKTFIIYNLSPQIDGEFDLNFHQIPFISNKLDENTHVPEISSSIYRIHVLKPEKNTMEFRGIPENLLTFSPKIPIEPDFLNKKALVLTEHEAIRNEKIQREKTLPWQKIFLSIIACVIFLGLRYYQKNKNADVPKEKETAKGKALVKLEKLQDMGLDLEMNIQELSDILRSYIEDGYQIRAKQKTTEEFLKTIEENPLTINFPKKALAEFLLLSDRVKFAKESVSESVGKTGYEIVRDFIRF